MSNRRNRLRYLLSLMVMTILPILPFSFLLLLLRCPALVSRTFALGKNGEQRWLLSLDVLHSTVVREEDEKKMRR